jgi:hypothetical protein
MKHRVILAAATAVLMAASLKQAASVAQESAPAPAPQESELPAYTPDGKLLFPASYREWVFLSSGLDMSYRKEMSGMGHSMFDNVFSAPRAYREFLKTGTWPDRTVLVMEVRGAATKGSINASGKFQTGELMGVETHVKDTKRFPGGWAFFVFQGTGPAPQIPVAAECYSCHQQHAAVDTTFVQFYPTLLPIAQAHNTVKAGNGLQ